MSALIIGAIVFVIGIISVVLYFVFSKKSNNVTVLQPTPSIQEPKAGSLEWCKRSVSKFKYVQEKPYDINGFSMGRCEDYSDELEKFVISNNPNWKGSLFVGRKQSECLSKLQPIIDNFKSSGTGDSKTVFGFRVPECNDYKDKVKTAMMGVNPGYLGTIEFS